VAIAICEEASGLTSAQLDQLRQQCVASGGGVPDGGVQAMAQFSAGPCSHAGALGGCRIVSGGMTATIWYYSNGGFTSADIQMLCATAGATFVAP